MTKPTKWHVRSAKTLNSLGIRPVWSESSLGAWIKLGSLATQWAHCEDSDQTGRMPRIIWVFAGCTVILLVLSWGGSNAERNGKHCRHWSDWRSLIWVCTVCPGLSAQNFKIFTLWFEFVLFSDACIHEWCDISLVGCLPKQIMWLRNQKRKICKYQRIYFCHTSFSMMQYWSPKVCASINIQPYLCPPPKGRGTYCFWYGSCWC